MYTKMADVPRILCLEPLPTPRSSVADLLNHSYRRGLGMTQLFEFIVVGIESVRTAALPFRFWELLPLVNGLAVDVREIKKQSEGFYFLRDLAESADREGC